METLFTAEYRWLWIIMLGTALFFPVRHMIWVMTVRRAIAKDENDSVDEAEISRLKKRASVTSFLLSFLFSLFYVSTWFRS